jgi:CheY-like chemotaxis protein
VQEIVAGAVETSQPAMDEQGHRFMVDMQDAPLEVQADAARLIQVIANLLQNAARCSDPGASILLEVGAEADMVRIAVRDTGHGIAPDFLPAVFDMYAQADRAGGRAGEGLGIGLALVKKLVLLHQGRIEARSAGLGQGSEFIVHIPRAPATEQAKPAAASGGARRAVSPLRVLVMDDNIDAADSLALALQAAGHQTTAAYTAQSALDLAMQLQPEAVVLDIGMPDLDGYEVARRIRAQSWGRRSTLIALTGWGQAEDRRRALDAGFDHHMTKPADPLDLMRRLGRDGG